MQINPDYVPSYPRVEAALKARGGQYVTAQEIADELGITPQRVAADFGGMHDIGVATKIGGNDGTARACWDGPL